jgi:hypothetical protein
MCPQLQEVINRPGIRRPAINHHPLGTGRGIRNRLVNRVEFIAHASIVRSEDPNAISERLMKKSFAE